MTHVDVNPAWLCAECGHPAREHLGLTVMPCGLCSCPNMMISGDDLALALVVLDDPE